MDLWREALLALESLFHFANAWTKTFPASKAEYFFARCSDKAPFVGALQGQLEACLFMCIP